MVEGLELFDCISDRQEMIDGLLKCRGPASKTDIIAIRLAWLYQPRLADGSVHEAENLLGRKVADKDL